MSLITDFFFNAFEIFLIKIIASYTISIFIIIYNTHKLQEIFQTFFAVFKLFFFFFIRRTEVFNNCEKLCAKLLKNRKNSRNARRFTRIKTALISPLLYPIKKQKNENEQIIIYNKSITKITVLLLITDLIIKNISYKNPKKKPRTAKAASDLTMKTASPVFRSYLLSRCI